LAAAALAAALRARVHALRTPTKPPRPALPPATPEPLAAHASLRLCDAALAALLRLPPHAPVFSGHTLIDCCAGLAELARQLPAATVLGLDVEFTPRSFRGYTCLVQLSLQPSGRTFVIDALVPEVRRALRCSDSALARALDMYEKSSLEQRSDEVSAKVRKVKAEMKEAATRAYQDPALGAEAKERGNVAFKAGKWAEAIKEYSDAILRDPSNPAYYQNRATAQAKVMNYGGALEDCERALKLDAKFVKAMNRKGNCQVAMKEYHKAIETFKAALALEPTNQDTLDGLRLTQSKISEGSHGATDEERARRAMEDPEIQLLLRDPMVNAALEDLQKDQASAAKVMRDPVMKAKIEKLIGAWRAPRCRHWPTQLRLQPIRR
jgi:tetratricopeptide (TPR) repeat protein